MAGQYGEFVINLRRNNLNTSWGFRLQGGKEFNTYLSIQRVSSTHQPSNVGLPHELFTCVSMCWRDLQTNLWPERALTFKKRNREDEEEKDKEG